MGWITSILLFPAGTMRAVIKLGKILQRQAVQELHHPARTRRLSEELQERRTRGEISSEDEKEAQEAVLTTRMAPQPVKPPPDKVGSAQAQNRAGGQPSGAWRRAPVGGVQAGDVAAPEITQEMIAERAYHISESGEGGTDEENWLRAEAELRQGS